MKFSKLAQTYDRIQEAGSEPKRVRLLADLLRDADSKTLAALAHLTASEVVDPQLSDRLGIGPGMIRAALSALSGHAESLIDERVKQTGDMSEVVAEFVKGSDTLTVDALWARVESNR
jgi:hypothetical protein